MFHRKCGDRVSLTNNNCTAVRNLTEYNYGLVLSAEPLQDDQVFEVRIDKKMMAWSGNIEIGITSADPENIELPACATNLCRGTWIMTNCGVIHDGELIVELYGTNLDTLEEGSTLGVMRTTNAELVFFVNGISQGVAATNIPPRVFAVIDMYGNCVQVTITQPRPPDPKEQSEFNNNDYAVQETSSTSTNLVANLNVNLNVNVNVSVPKNAGATRDDKLRFHERVGSLVKLSNNSRTAERRRALDEFNNGVVMTHRPLRDDELFEIRIDRLVDKWSGSIEVGVTTHSPTALEFPATMTNMRSGTTMMSGCGILNNGKGTQREYGEFNLDELREGDRVGMIRKSNGNLHYFINGLDQGIAAIVPAGVWGVIDLYGMTVKVTIVDRDEREEQNLVTRRNTMHLQGLNEGDEDLVERLVFHPRCGTRADVINNGRTAHRPNAFDDFNNGVVLTSRPLKPNELFEVRLDKIVTKWAGSIEIGVTTHSPTKLEFPFTMTNVRSGTWMMTGNGVMHNGTTIIEQYGQNLDKLHVGDRVGVMRKENATLHFYVNGVDQGAAAMSVPERVYGVIDLYGQAAQATIVDNREFCSPATNNSSFSNTTLYSDMRFHLVHGKNARITNNGLTASRPRALGEFNDAIVIANRALRDAEMFEVSIDRMVGRWTGAIEAGVTAIKPNELEFPPTMTDIDHDTWILSGSTVMRDGVALRHNYACDLDRLAEGNRIGMMRCADGTLHYYLDGVDQGVACSDLPPHVYPVIDLYGQCAQVTIILPEQRDTMTQQYLPSENSTSQQPTSVIQMQAQAEATHKFHESVGLNIRLNNERTIANRCREYNNAILISEAPLESNELFEITIQEVAQEWSGALRIGVMRSGLASWLTAMNLVPGMTTIPADAWYLGGNQVRHKGYVLSLNYCPSLEWLRANDKIGLKVTHDGNLKFYINGEDMGIAASNLPEVYVVVELFGSTTAVGITSSKQPNTVISPNASLRLQDSLELLLDPMPPMIRNDAGMDTSVDTSEAKLLNEMVLTPTQAMTSSDDNWSYEFHENHGRNVQLETKSTARRVASYNQGVVMTSRPLMKNKMFQVKIDKTNERWVSNILCGVTCISPEKANFPLTALGFKKHSWIICSDWMSHNGTKVKTKYGANLEDIQLNSTIGLLIDEDSRLHLYINDVDQGIAATDLPPYVYGVIDLYGQCEQISIVNSTCDPPYTNHDSNTVSTVGRTAVDVEDFENSREKAALECHEKETGTSSNLSLNIPLQAASLSHDEHTSTPYPSHSSSNSDSSDTPEHSKDKPYVDNILSDNNTDLCNLNEECTNVEINNATNINIKNGTAISNNAINENIACNSQNNENNSHGNNVQEQLQLSFARLQLNNCANQNQSLISSVPSTPIGTALQPTRKCEYLKACTRFKKSLVLPDDFFSLDEVMCYCSSCCKLEGDNAVCKKGEPLAEYVVPVGWTRFPLKQSSNANQIPQSTIDKWHVAFYATRLEAIRWILDSGELLTKEQLDTSNLTTTINTENQNPQVVFSPNIKHADPEKFARQYPYIDTESNKKLNASTAFQLLVRPGSYTLNSKKDGDAECIEWSTKEAGATAIVALLIHLDGF